MGRSLGWVTVCLLGMAVLSLAAYVFTALWASNEFSQVESIVGLQSRALSEGEPLYHTLTTYPFSVRAYMPIFYTVSAVLQRAGLEVLSAGRLISLAALGGILFLIWRTAWLYTRERAIAWLALALGSVSQLLAGWGTIGQVDMLAICLSFGGFYQFSRYRLEGVRSLDLAAWFCVAGLFTKQTVLAVPAAIALSLLLSEPRKALRFAAIVGGAGGVMVLTADWFTNGRFLANTVFANMNPFVLRKLAEQVTNAIPLFLPLLVIVGCGLVAARGRMQTEPFLHLAFAIGVYILTAGKLGSERNYQLEIAVSLALCAGISLHSLDFAGHLARRSLHWITVLVLQLGVYGVQNVRIAYADLMGRYANELLLDAQYAEIGELVSGPGRVLSTDSNLLLRAGKAIEVEPLIYRLLVEAGRIDPASVCHDLETQAFQSIVLYEDVSGKPDLRPEIPRLTEPQMEIIRQRYQLQKFAAGPYVGGVFVYQPRPDAQP